jgi:hypothetical protein
VCARKNKLRNVWFLYATNGALRDNYIRYGTLRGEEKYLMLSLLN